MPVIIENQFTQAKQGLIFTVILGRLAQMVSNGTAAILITFMVIIETIRNVIR